MGWQAALNVCHVNFDDAAFININTVQALPVLRDMQNSAPFMQTAGSSCAIPARRSHRKCHI